MDFIISLNFFYAKQFLLAFFTTLLVVTSSTWYILNSKSLNKFLDIPNQRSLHVKPIPRLGGLAVMNSIIFSTILYCTELLFLLPFLLVLIALSFFDDLIGIKPLIRLAIHFLTALIFLFTLDLHISYIFFIILLFYLVWVLNLYNFMDGSDGLASGMSIIGFSCYAILSIILGDISFAIFNIIIIASCIGFLFFNFPPAKIFMGDTGSIPLGFLCGALGVIGWYKTLWPLWFPLVIFSPFILDSGVTLVKRVLKKESLLKAHRSHYYQRAILVGYSHKQVALFSYGLMICVGIIGILAAVINTQEIIIIMIILLFSSFVLMMRFVDIMWAKHLLKKNK
ncbi:glycosyltransferase family 4 protein [Methylophilaceae bacterium]|nr:glycosyltransferase family 4 protein [Methylophilaceae bacterium]